MEKASTVLRRSSVKLRTSLGGSPHGDLQMVIGQLKDVKATQRAMAQSEAAAWQDLTKWSLKDENRAIQDAICQAGELATVWADVQKQMNESLKDFRHQFEMVMEGERGLDAARAALESAELKETRTKKELKKASKKATQAELTELSRRLSCAEREKDIAQLEVFDRVREHEIVKMIRVKDGLLKMTQAYIDTAQKCELLFSASNFIAQQIPDINGDRDIVDVKYTGSGATMNAVHTAKNRIKNFRRSRRTFVDESGHVAGAGALSTAPQPDDLPPPYSETPPAHNPYYDTPPRQQQQQQQSLPSASPLDTPSTRTTPRQHQTSHDTTSSSFSAMNHRHHHHQHSPGDNAAAEEAAARRSLYPRLNASLDLPQERPAVQETRQTSFSSRRRSDGGPMLLHSTPSSLAQLPSYISRDESLEEEEEEKLRQGVINLNIDR